MISAAFFDLDRTLISVISGNALVRTAWRKRLIAPEDMYKAFLLYMKYKLTLRAPLDVISEMTAWVRGRKESELEELCRIATVELLLPSIHAGAFSEITRHRESGRKTVILSSALDHICRAIAAELGMDDYICSSLEAVDGYLTGRPAGRICFGPEKLSRLTGYCRTEGIDISLSWYYTDAISDLPVLEVVGHPVCVNPDRALRKEALYRGWPVLSWKVS